MKIIEAINNNYNLFKKYNELKIHRFQQLFPNAAIKKTINAIPVLLSINDKKVPGFSNADVPLGIANYTPDTETLRYVKARFGFDSYNDVSKPFVHCLAVMGSVGTIGYNRKSDFDYWACVDKRGVSEKHLAAFQKKIDDIQKWVFKESGAEVHIFINDISNLKMNIFAEDEDEGFGSTIGGVLKDEFFRSSMIIAGKVPFWWVVPGFINDSDYEKLFALIPDKEKNEKYVDIGNLFQISREDFLGAALFQLIKAVGSPFKSILKIGILEKYLFMDGKTVLLSQKLKASIQRGKLKNSAPDSYLIMFNEVYRYYEEILDDKSLLTILRQNLYLKIDPQLSRYVALKERKDLPYKVMVMFRVVKGWGWSIEEIRDLDDFESWDYNRIILFWNSVKKFMLLSYQKISREMPNMDLQNKISSSDFKLLNSIIKANFLMEPDKIENFITFKDTPNEPLLYIEAETGGVKVSGWRVYKKIRLSGRLEKEIGIKSEDDLVKLLAWCSINQIYEPTFSRVFFESGYHHINKNLVVELLNHIFEMFNSEKTHIKREFFLREPRTLKNMLIMNFSESKANDINSFCHLYINTWGESFIKNYSAYSEMIAVFSKIVKDGVAFGRSFDDFCFFVSPEPHKRLYKRVEKIFRAAFDFLLKSKDYVSQRFITNFDNSLVCITKKEGNVSVASFDSILELLSNISMSPFVYPDLKIYSEDNSSLEILDEIYSKRTVNGFSIVYEDKGRYTAIYVCDENGNLFTFVKMQSGHDPVLAVYRFCLNILDLIKAGASNKTIRDDIKCFQLTVDRFGKYSFKDESKKISQFNRLNPLVKDSLFVEVVNSSKERPYYILQKGPAKIGPFAGHELKDKVKFFGSDTERNMEIAGVKFHVISDEMKLWGATPYFLEKYKVERLLGVSI
ncbi:MAG: class I adenylate cyclase [Spirochaetota bacterium]